MPGSLFIVSLVVDTTGQRRAERAVAKDSGGGTAAAAARPGTLAEAATATAEGPKATKQAPATVVAEAVRRRAAGESYAAIGRALGLPPRRVSGWCREADPASATKRPRATTKSRPVAVRLPLPLHREVTKRAGGGPVGAAVVDLVAAGLAKPKLDDTAVLSAARRRLLSSELVAASNAMSALEVQVRAVGRLANQVARYLGTYRELPVAITDELAAIRESLDTLLSEAAAIRATVDGLVA